MISFYGQTNLFLEVTNIVEVIKQGECPNLMLKAQSGYGKTTFGSAIVGLIQQALPNVAAMYYLPDKEGKIEFNSYSKVHFIDEVHKLKDPELLYQQMDSKKFIFILATNKFGGLEEALENRCISLIFKDYSDEELVSLARHYLKLEVNSTTIDTIIGSSNRVPREMVKLCERLNYYFFQGTPTDKEIEECISNVFSINDGLNALHQKYLTFLNKVKLASLDTIAYGLKLDRDIVRREIEPTLIAKGLITITSRGRKVCEDETKLW